MEIDIIRPPPPVVPAWFYLLVGVVCIVVAVGALRGMMRRTPPALPGLRLRGGRAGPGTGDGGDAEPA